MPTSTLIPPVLALFASCLSPSPSEPETWHPQKLEAQLVEHPFLPSGYAGAVSLQWKDNSVVLSRPDGMLIGLTEFGIVTFQMDDIALWCGLDDEGTSCWGFVGVGNGKVADAFCLLQMPPSDTMSYTPTAFGCEHGRFTYGYEMWPSEDQ